MRTRHPFAGKLICGDCGSFYSHKVWRLRSTGEHYNVWYCNHKYDGDKACESPRLRDEEVKATFEKMLQKCGDPNPVYTDGRWNKLVESVKVCRGGPTVPWFFLGVFSKKHLLVTQRNKIYYKQEV
ncbi:zinc ribbon domain-containing protein [Mordavella massiliensis]|uniref:zinc ribbon domain-containing protein n=1 Tax=Mordavella massiliensis TaxID=1871024 RepID=UPI0030B916E5